MACLVEEPNGKNKPPLLFTPIQFGRVFSKNRICISPMCQYSCEDGFVNEWHLVHLGARAIGGAGIVMMEATAVEPRGRISDKCPGIWKDQHIDYLKKICQFIKSQKSVPAIQLAHAGRKGSRCPPWEARSPLPEEKGWQIIGPSAIPFEDGFNKVPKESTFQDIHQIKLSFVQAAKRAIEAGFEIIELHFAHGYLVHSFLSPLSNKRTDQYGGSFENRIRFALELVNEVKSVIPEDYPLFVRISCTDYADEEKGWDLEQSVELCKRLKHLGVSLVDCSSGGNIPSNRFFIYNNVDQIQLAETIQKKALIATGAVGGIVNGWWAESILREERASLIFIGRVSLDDPNWPMHAAFELGAHEYHQIPPQYNWSIGPNTSGKWRQTVLHPSNHHQLND